MPTYTYKCMDCEEVFDVVHLMSEKCTECVTDGCTATSGFVKILQGVTVRKSKSNNREKPGSVVNRHIEETKQEVEAEKNRMRQEEYKPK